MGWQYTAQAAPLAAGPASMAAPASVAAPASMSGPAAMVSHGVVRGAAAPLPQYMQPPQAARSSFSSASPMPTSSRGLVPSPSGPGCSPSHEEYHHLLKLVMAQEARLERQEQEILRHRSENEELHKHVVSLTQNSWMHHIGSGSGGPSSFTARTGRMGSVAEDFGSEFGSTRRSTRAGRPRSHSPRTPVSPGIIVPYALPKESLLEKYIVDWDANVHTGTLNGLTSGKFSGPTLSSFFKGKAKANSSQRIIKTVRKQQAPFPKLMEQQIADLRGLDHPNICRLMDAFEDDTHVFQVFEILAGPSLAEKVLTDPGFCERDASAAMKCVLQALVHLHSRSIAHQNVHLENMRFARQPRKTYTGSAYGDQLKLMDMGLSLNRHQIPMILTASSSPSPASPTGRSQAVVPLLAPLGFQNSIGVSFLAPECKGLCTSYAQLAAASGSMLQNSRSAEVLPGVGSSLASRERSPVPSRSSVSSWQDLSSRRSKDLLRVLQVGDMWALGCCLHILLSGEPPQPEEMPSSPTPGHVPQLESLRGIVSAAARELCSALLQTAARRRPGAEEALESPWFAQCEAPARAHRSVVKQPDEETLAILTARPKPFWEKLRRSLAAAQLTRLYHAVRSVRACSTANTSAADSQLHGPPGNVDARTAADNLCFKAFELLKTACDCDASTVGDGLPMQQLTKMLQNVGQSELTSSFRQFQEPETFNAEDAISAQKFADIVWTTCG